jgi:hypothetical protein
MKRKKSGTKPLKKSIKDKVVELAIMEVPQKEIAEKAGNISVSSVEKIKRENRDIIEAEKQKYIALIDSATGGDKAQAKILKGLLKARNAVYNFQGKVVGHRPDFRTRLDTVKYLDKLKGREAPQVTQLTQNNVVVAQELEKYMR